MWYERAIELGLVPDWLLVLLIRTALKKYSNRISSLSENELESVQHSFITQTSVGPIAKNTRSANVQHYEVPTSFFQYVLGDSMKYSGSVWSERQKSLNTSDNSTLVSYAKKASISDGQSILDLGAGWGSFSLTVAREYPACNVTALTNSNLQKKYIQERINRDQLRNLSVVKSDINVFSPSQRYDRIVSIEMFEHIRNPTVLLNRIHSWLYPDALLFIQVFSHRNFPQFFNRGNSSWMADNFFSGGIMPYDGYYGGIQSGLRLLKTWTIPGMNYHKTLEFWLNNLRKNRTKILADGPNFVGGKPFSRYVNKYRVFLIFCSELFRFNGGNDWHLMHYLFQK